MPRDEEANAVDRGSRLSGINQSRSSEAPQVEIPVSPESVSLISGISKAKSREESVQASDDISPVSAKVSRQSKDQSRAGGLADFALQIQRMAEENLRLGEKPR